MEYFQLCRSSLLILKWLVHHPSRPLCLPPVLLLLGDSALSRGVTKVAPLQSSNGKGRICATEEAETICPHSLGICCSSRLPMCSGGWEAQLSPTNSYKESSLDAALPRKEGSFRELVKWSYLYHVCTRGLSQQSICDSNGPIQHVDFMFMSVF